MAFRKTSYAKVFVDDALPSFLVQQQEATAHIDDKDSMRLSPALAAAGASPPAAAAPVITAERRNRSLALRPGFLLKLVVVAVLVNALLYGVFHVLPKHADAAATLTLLGAATTNLGAAG